MANLFAKATKAEVAVPAAKKAAGTFEIAGAEEYASIDAAIKALTAVKVTLEAEIKAAGVGHFIDKGMKDHKRPANFKVTEGAATLSLQLKSRGSNIAIGEDDQKRLRASKIPLATVDTITKTFIINPAYAEDEKLLEKVSKALEKVAGLPEDFIQMQEQTKVVVDGDATIDAIFSLKSRATIEDLLPLVTTTAIRPSLSTEIDAAINNVGRLLGLDIVAKKKEAKKKEAKPVRVK